MITLTLRQIEICFHLAKGQALKEVALSLSISYRTVLEHINRAILSNGLRSRDELMFQFGYMFFEKERLKRDLL